MIAAHARHAIAAVPNAVLAQRILSEPETAKSAGAMLSFRRDQEIVSQEAPARRLFRVVSGVVRTVRLLNDGRRQVGAFYFPGDWCGVEPSAFHRFAAEAVSDATVEAHDRSSMIALADDRRFGAELTAAAIAELSRAQDHLLLLGRKTAEERVGAFLYDLYQRDITDMPMRRQDIADYLGLTIETVSRMLTQLQSAGIVQVSNSRRLRVLDAEALALLAA